MSKWKTYVKYFILLPLACYTLLVTAVFFFNSWISTDDSDGPPTVSETSAARPKLSDRIQFFEQFVKFRRNYKQLEYDITFHNNADTFPPGPSDWDIMIVASIDPIQIDQWAVDGKRDLQMITPQWVSDVAGTLKTDSISEWYNDGGRVVGIDRENNIIAYRNFAN